MAPGARAALPPLLTCPESPLLTDNVLLRRPRARQALRSLRGTSSGFTLEALASPPAGHLFTEVAMFAGWAEGAGTAGRPEVSHSLRPGIYSSPWALATRLWTEFTFSSAKYLGRGGGQHG
ncbi:hypothetical protein TREES_T100004255 [Tupaia chinensis]|uniref:Uncharacterized protein n=1 Tax=Tupaia chinensis TaxID=246437 RepID=L9KLP4_TUPCH|nr:hypothetical protein TREES_T100004255 [Tupaia chinensis]